MLSRVPWLGMLVMFMVHAASPGAAGLTNGLFMPRTNAELMGHSVPAGGVHAQVRLLWLLRLHARTRHTVRQHLHLQADGTRSRSGEWGRCGVR